MKRLKERDCYNLLRDECGFTHYGVRVVARKYMWSPRWRRALEKEKQQFKLDNAEEIEAIALRCLRPAPQDAGMAVLAIAWNNPKHPPAICWETCLEVVKTIGRVMEYDKEQKQTVRQTVDKLRKYEKKKMENRWTENLITAYLTIKGHLPPP